MLVVLPSIHRVRYIHMHVLAYSYWTLRDILVAVNLWFIIIIIIIIFFSMLAASFNGLYYSLHITMYSMINQLHLWTHTYFNFSLHLSMFSCFDNHLMEMYLQLSFIFCTSIFFPLQSLFSYAMTTRRVESSASWFVLTWKLHEEIK